LKSPPVKKFEDRLKEIVSKDKIKRLAIDENDIKASEVLQIKKAVRICSDGNLIEDLRKVKDDSEVDTIKKACQLGDKTFKYILSEIKLGVSEKTLAKKIGIFILENNAEVSFRPIVAFGKNSSSPHHIPSERKLKRNEIILLDFGVKTEGGYCSDMTRTVFFGRATDKQKKIYKTVLNSQKKGNQIYSVLNFPSSINQWICS